MSSPVRGYEPFSSHQFRSFDCHRFRKVERLSLFSFCILCIDHVNDLSLVNVLTVLDIGDILYESSVHLEREFFSVYWRTDSLISSNRWISLMVLHAKLARSLDDNLSDDNLSVILRRERIRRNEGKVIKIYFG